MTFILASIFFISCVRVVAHHIYRWGNQVMKIKAKTNEKMKIEQQVEYAGLLEGGVISYALSALLDPTRILPGALGLKRLNINLKKYSLPRGNCTFY